MTEEDTFKALKKWSFEELDAKIADCASVNLEGERIRVAGIFEEASWSQDEYISEYRHRWHVPCWMQRVFIQ